MIKLTLSITRMGFSAYLAQTGNDMTQGLTTGEQSIYSL